MPAGADAPAGPGALCVLSRSLQTTGVFVSTVKRTCFKLVSRITAQPGHPVTPAPGRRRMAAPCGSRLTPKLMSFSSHGTSSEPTKTCPCTPGPPAVGLGERGHGGGALRRGGAGEAQLVLPTHPQQEVWGGRGRCFCAPTAIAPRLDLGVARAQAPGVGTGAGDCLGLCGSTDSPLGDSAAGTSSVSRHIHWLV